MKITRRDFLLASGLGSAFFAKQREMQNMTFFYPQKEKSKGSSYDAWVELNLENMAWNLERIKNQVKVAVMGVIKANGYGHGLIEVAQFLEKKRIDYLMVGKLQEALIIRNSGIQSPILNFGPFDLKDAEEIIINNISQCVFTEELEDLHSVALKLSKRAMVHVHIDTGMGRAGLPYYEAFPFIEKAASLEGIDVVGVSTTLTEDYDFDREQMRRFLSLCQKAEKEGISLGQKHAASSSGILTLPSSHLDMVRPGIMLYGYYPSEETQKKDSLSLRPVLQLKTRVFVIKTLRPGDSVSYHRAYIVKKREKMALLPIGYSDGYPFNIVDKASVLIRGKRFPLIGNITANHMEVSLGNNSQVSPGDEVVLIGIQGKEKISADEVAAWAGVSTYKILLQLNPLLPRTIVERTHMHSLAQSKNLY